jgi:hypothetical protein
VAKAFGGSALSTTARVAFDVDVDGNDDAVTHHHHHDETQRRTRQPNRKRSSNLAKLDAPWQDFLDFN